MPLPLWIEQIPRRCSLVHCFCVLLAFGNGPAISAEVKLRQLKDSLEIAIGNQVVAEYVFEDAQVLRPYFRHLRTLSGVQVTRNHPPVKGEDLDDHPTMHPGLWLAFGDLSGTDFWRNQGRVRRLQPGTLEVPLGSTNSFIVENAYEAGGKTLCKELRQITVNVDVDVRAYLIDWQSTFESPEGFTLGDQEEMGLGVRMATPLAVVHGGEIVNSEGRRNERQVWGRQAEWCSYSGHVDDRRVGIAVLPSPDNFRPSWFHARDYGLLVANPFGRNAFTKAEKSLVTVKAGEKFQLRFRVIVFESPTAEPVDIPSLYRNLVRD